MSFEFRPAKRENVPLLIGLAGGTGSGKTYSAMLLAKGLSGGNKFAVIDTENGRARLYADEFAFDDTDLREPFTPGRYADAIAAADAAGYPVIVVDSMSHEYAGDGGLLDYQEQELHRLAGDDLRRRDAMKMASWIRPKMQHKKMVSRLLQVKAHLILCFRAEEKIEIVKENGKTVIRAKETRTGKDGWVPLTEKNLPYELTLSFLLTEIAPGVPRPIKLMAQHKPLFPEGKPITDEVGVALAAWAAGGATPTRPRVQPTPEPAAEDPINWGDDSGIDPEDLLADKLLVIAERIGKRDTVEAAIAKNRSQHSGDLAAHVAWLESQIARAEAKTTA